jgi:hypothetical protein
VATEPTLVTARYGFGSPPIPRPGFTPVPPGIFDEWRKHAERGLAGLFDWYSRSKTIRGVGAVKIMSRIAEKNGRRPATDAHLKYRYDTGTIKV